jgi:hypothetical protein
VNRLEQIIGRELTSEERAWFTSDLHLSALAGMHPVITPPAATTAAEILREAASVIEQRATLRDLPNGERSMARAVEAYNALSGKSLTELDGWIFMCVLKMARATAGKPHLDDFTDLAGYAALAAEGVKP